jgi:hypothetical protein
MQVPLIVTVSPAVVRGASASAEATVPPWAQLTMQAIGFEVTWPSGGTFWQLNPAGDCTRPSHCARPSPGPANHALSNANAAIFARDGKQETVFIDVLR